MNLVSLASALLAAVATLALAAVAALLAALVVGNRVLVYEFPEGYEPVIVGDLCLLRVSQLAVHVLCFADAVMVRIALLTCQPAYIFLKRINVSDEH